MLRGNTLGWLFPFPLGSGFGCGEDLGGSCGIEGGSGLCTPGAKAELSKPLPRLTQRGLGSISKPLPLDGGSVEDELEGAAASVGTEPLTRPRRSCKTVRPQVR